MYVASQITKHYGGVKALDGVDLEIRPGEVQALLGANGAGKSTLVKILVGAELPTSGTLALDGKELRFENVAEAAARGIAIVSQELNLFPDFDVLHNLFLLREPLSGGLFVDRAEMWRRAQPVVEAVGLDVPLHRKLGTLRLGEQQLVEIARALLDDPRILILDEPTSALQAAETQRLLGVVRRLKERGVGVVYVSHHLEDVFAVADNVTVFRNGRAVLERRACGSISISETVGFMLGEGAAKGAPRAAAARVEETVANTEPLRLDGVEVRGLLEPTSLVAQPGEVVGLAGLDGSGANTVLDVVFGRRRANAGTVTLPGGGAAPSGMTAGVRAGIAYVPADRKRLGVMLQKPIYENVATVTAGPLRRMGVVLRTQHMLRRSEHWRSALKIKAPSSQVPVGALSGGNQQKVVFAKWLEADPRVVLLDDPSRGVDVGAKVEMHEIIGQMRASKRIVLYTSSDLEEMAEVCDRVVVFFQGRTCGELGGEELSEHQLLEAISTGVVGDADARA